MREGEVIVQIDGKSYSGSFIVDRGIMTVSAGVDSKTSPVGEMALEVRARLMLRDMVLRAQAGYPTRPPPEGNHTRRAAPPVGGGSAAATGLVSTCRWQAPLAELMEGPAE
jgi:hypothetical protein